MGRRRTSRELSLQILYQLEITGADACDMDEVLRSVEVGKRSEDILDYARKLAQGTSMHHQKIDDLIQQHADNWQLDRISIIDKNIMRQAIYEMIFAPEKIPPNVCINEALEIAKKYSSPLAPSFINGILDKVKQSSQSGVQT